MEKEHYFVLQFQFIQLDKERDRVTLGFILELQLNAQPLNSVKNR